MVEYGPCIGPAGDGRWRCRLNGDLIRHLSWSDEADAERYARRLSANRLRCVRATFMVRDARTMRSVPYVVGHDALIPDTVDDAAGHAITGGEE